MEAPFDLAVVCDDDPDIALAAKLALRDLFKEIETLPSPRELQEFIKARSPDAILLDLNFERAATDGSEGLDYLGRIMTADPEAAVKRQSVLQLACHTVDLRVLDEATLAGDRVTVKERGQDLDRRRAVEYLTESRGARRRVGSAALRPMASCALVGHYGDQGNRAI